MGESSIEWTKFTFNPWSGCTKVSPGCANCYAAALPPSMRRGAEWGDSAERVIAPDAYWQQPLAWDRAAAKAGERHRVFCASVADVFEDRPELHDVRLRVFDLIARTPNLDWLLLTKRPHVAVRYALQFAALPNVWLGASVENQRTANERIPWLLQVPAAVRFLSMEPLLGAVRLDLIPDYSSKHFVSIVNALDGTHGTMGGTWTGPRVGWVIVGGESGRRARPMDVVWARSLRDQCKAAGVPFFFKQGSVANWPNFKDFSSFPSDLQLREVPHVHA